MKYKRIFIQNCYVHVVVVTYNRNNILVENIDLLRKSFVNAKRFFDFEIVATCVLPDHFHLILNPKDINEYPKIITAIKYYFSRNVINVGVETPTYGYKNKGEKGVWQRRYYEHTITSEKDLNNQIDYIHFNPVKHGLAKNVQDWEFSTFNKFVKSGNYEVHWGSADDIKDIKNLQFD